MPPYEVSQTRLSELRGRGFTLLPGALPDSILRRWQQLAEELEAKALAAHEQSEHIHGACVIEDPVGPRLMRYDDVLGVDPAAVIELLACPAMVAVARDMCGRGAIPLQLDILYKHQHPHPIILWHQGAQHPRGYPYLNVGIYLDDADADDGCLKYVPETQHELQDIAGLASTHGWDIPGVVEQPARAGDILIQDMMVLHGSAPKRSPGVRRTIYVEIRAADGVRESGVQSEEWIALRERWMSLVLRAAESDGWPQEWQQDYPADLGPLEEEAEKIIAHWEPPIPAVYSTHSIEAEGYPVPTDMLEVPSDAGSGSLGPE